MSDNKYLHNSLLNNESEMTEESLFSAVVYVGIAMGIGATINIILEKYGITISNRIPIEIEANPYDSFYLETKKNRMGHILNMEEK